MMYQVVHKLIQFEVQCLYRIYDKLAFFIIPKTTHVCNFLLGQKYSEDWVGCKRDNSDFMEFRVEFLGIWITLLVIKTYILNN